MQPSLQHMEAGNLKIFQEIAAWKMLEFPWMHFSEESVLIFVAN